MGAGVCTIRFKEQLPSFIQIQSAFHELTGLHLSLIADLQIQQLSDSAHEIFSQLEKDVDAVAKIEKARKEFYKTHPQQYEKMAQFRDEINKQLSQMSHIKNVRFTVYGFYEIDFSIEENEIELYFFYGQEYAFRNLLRVLVDLGGKLYDGDSEKDRTYPEKWKTYKKWQEYKWYNRPRK